MEGQLCCSARLCEGRGEPGPKWSLEVGRRWRLELRGKKIGESLVKEAEDPGGIETDSEV